VKTKKKVYVELQLKDDLTEERPDHSLFAQRPRTALLDVLEALRSAGRDPGTAALFLTLDGLGVGWSRLTSVRRAILEFRSKGKPVYCFMESGGNAEYYVATACDRIFVAPAGSLHVVGLHAQVFFLREVLERYGLQPELFAVGEYKSAGEMFTRDNMSGPSREQLEALLDDYYEEFCRALSERGALSREEVTERINAGPYTARGAAAQGLIDEACYSDEAVQKLKDALGGKAVSRPAARYYPREGFFRRLATFRRPRVAVVDVVGTIASGPSRRLPMGRQVAGAETIGKFLEHATESSRIRGILLRIDSPGGSGIASDVLWRKISQARERKPVVVSFGDVAASGGYYIAAAGSRIFCEDTSITGSIGVLGGKFVAAALMDRMAIHREFIQRGEHAGYASWLLPFSPSEAALVQRQMEEFYRDDFVRKVAEGRKMSEEAVDKVGRGRVWTGARARALGLIDQTGGPLEAIDDLRRLAGIAKKKKIRLVHYQKRRRLLEMLIPDLTAGAGDEMQNMLGLLTQIAREAILLWMPHTIRIR
jgi:protease IV